MKKPIYLVEYQKAFGAGMHPFTKTFSDIKDCLLYTSPSPRD